MEKRGQIAIFVIIALVIVGGVIAYFAIRNLPQAGTQAVFNPTQAVEKCVEDSVNEATDIMIPQGGFLEPKLYHVYNDTKITYLCYTPRYYKPCVNQHPMLLTEVKEQIKGYIKPKIEQCFSSMKDEAGRKNIAVELGAMNFDVSLAPNRIFVDISRETKITEKDSSRTLDKYNFEIINPIYDLANVAKDIVNEETIYCNFNYLVYMFIDKEFDIRKNKLSEDSVLYAIKDKNSGKIMNIAVKGCSLPAGLPDF